MMKGNINLISYDCYQQATEKQLAGLKWKENRVYYISEIHNEKMQDEIYGYIDDRCRRLSLSTVVNDIYRFDLLKEFLNEKCTSCSSITDKKWEELERSYKAFLYKKGLAQYPTFSYPIHLFHFLEYLLFYTSQHTHNTFSEKKSERYFVAQHSAYPVYFF